MYLQDKYSRNNASIFYFSILTDGKVNLDDPFGRKNLKFLVVFKNARKNEKKIKEKQEFLRELGF